VKGERYKPFILNCNFELGTLNFEPLAANP
jgi:hypothetical protein